MFFKYSLREILANKKFTLVFCFNIALGFFGLTLVNIFSDSFNKIMAQKSSLLLGADFAVKTRYLPHLEKIEAVEAHLPKIGRKAYIKEFFSMVRSLNGDTRLVMLANLENGFPFYGGLIVGDKLTPSHMLEDDSVWVYPEVLTLLNVAIGDSLKIGEAVFKISGVIKEDSRAGLGMGALAPRVYITTHGMEKTELLKFGSTVFHGFYYTFKEKISQHELKKIIHQIEKDIPEREIRYLTPLDATEQTARSINYLSDFLGLIALISLFMAQVGVFFLYRTFLRERKNDMAILKCLGMSFGKLSFNYYFHLIVMGIIGALISLILTAATLPIIYGVIKYYLAIELHYSFDSKPLFVILAICLCSNILIGIPLITPLNKRKIGEIFNEYHIQDDISWKNTFYDKLYFVPWGSFFYFLSIYVCNSIKIGSIFFFSFLAILLITYPMIYMLLHKIEYVSCIKNFILRLVLKSLSRNKISTLSFFLALTFSSMLITLIPMLKANIQDEFTSSRSIETPSLFLFDIQEEQVDPLFNIFEKYHLKVPAPSPMVRARFKKINGKALEFDSYNESDGFRTREEMREQQTKRRTLNLTFKDKLSDAEKIVKGREFNALKTFPEASVEIRYAKRMNIDVGDTLEFDILGLRVEAKVTSLRSVRWTSFTPNFFVALNSGIIDDAPKTFLWSIPKLEPQVKINLEREIVKEFSNISIINLEETITKILKMVEQMGMALQMMSIICIVIGPMLIYAVVSHSFLSRIHEMGLLKLLGLKKKSLKKILYMEYFLITTVASILGIGFSYIMSYILVVSIFDGYYTAIFIYPIIVFVSIEVLVFGLVKITSAKIVKTQIATLFNELRV